MFDFHEIPVSFEMKNCNLFGPTELNSTCNTDRLLGGRARGALRPQPTGEIQQPGNLKTN